MQKCSVIIGIQARSTSTRLPGKALMKLAGVPMLQRVIDRCIEASKMIKADAECRIIVLCPTGDPIATSFRGIVPVIEGPENDVLSRYMIVAKEFYPDYVVRITADCPRIQSHMIARHIDQAIGSRIDYCTNTLDPVRTAADGDDVEVVSLKLLNWLHEEAKKPYDREHVTALLRTNPPSWWKVKIGLQHVDESKIKRSVDTPEDFQREDFEITRIEKKIEYCENKDWRIFRL